MSGRRGSLFAGRGIPLPGFLTSALVLTAALGLGVGAGWATSAITQAVTAADESPSPTPSGIDVDVTLAPLAPITRTLTQDDQLAGIITTDVAMTGDGTLSVVSGAGEEVDGAGDVRWVSVAVEDGIDVDAAAFSDYVMKILRDNRGWGSGGTMQFVSTDAAADYRVILASPATAKVLCPNQNLAVEAGPVVGSEQAATPGASPQASTTAPVDPSASATPSPLAERQGPDVLCDSDGAVVISIYDWIAGVDAFGKDYDQARAYLILHRLGHLLGESDVTCASGVAPIMVNQEEDLPKDCEANPWPFPDAPSTLPLTGESGGPSPTSAA